MGDRDWGFESFEIGEKALQVTVSTIREGPKAAGD